jgi:hypothetical protein
VPDAWLIWWSALVAATAINAAAWCFSARLLERRKATLSPDVLTTRRLLLALAAVYVIGCGFRSVLPMVDVPRICLHDTWISRIAVGRTVATVAELAFAVQWALLLREVARAARSGVALHVSRAIVPMIVLAEVCSWYAVLTTNNLLHAFENSLWTLAAVMAAAVILAVRELLDEKGRQFAAAALACAAGYVAFMTITDVPMYLARWQADVTAGHEYLELREGMRELLQRCVVTRDWNAWGQDVPWLSLYFTIAVWISIALAHVPPLARRKGSRHPFRTAPGPSSKSHG